MRFYLASELKDLEQQLIKQLQPWMEKWFSPKHEKKIISVKPFVKSEELEVIEDIYFDFAREDLPELFSGKAQPELNEHAKNIYSQLWQRSVMDLKSSLLIENVVNHSNLDDLPKLGSGAVSISLLVSHIKINFVLSGDQVSKLIPQLSIKLEGSEPLASSESLINEALNIKISTQPIKLGYQQVKNLKVGDKLILKHKVDQPLNVEVSNKSIATAYVAACSGKKAIVMEGK